MTQEPSNLDGADEQPVNGEVHNEAEEPKQKSNEISAARKWIWAGGLLVALYFLADGVIGVLTSSPEQGVPAPTVTVTAQAPTPAATAIERSVHSNFSDALPATSRQFALAKMDSLSDWPNKDAVEAFSLIYTGMVDDRAENIDVYATQFKDAESAQAAFDVRLGEGWEPLESGEVSVRGAVVGYYTIAEAISDTNFPVGPTGETIPVGTARALWTNGVGVFEAYAPKSEIVNFYKDFSL